MAERATTLAKLSRPRLPPVATRERLFRRLDTLRDSPCIWLCGPPGSGKTTLAADYLRARGETSFWFHVDEGDHDPSATIAYLVALASRADNLASTLPYLTSEHLTDLAGFYRQFFRRFYQFLPADSTIVFDNCHRASGENFASLLRSAIDEIPPGIRLIALSRHQLPAELVKAEANRQVVTIDAEDLRLHLEEAADVTRVMGVRPNTDIQDLHAMCDGWIAGLVLMLTHAGSSDRDPGPRLDRSSRESIFAYFASELLQAADPALRDLLLRTALLPAVTAELAQDLTGNTEAGALLDGLYRRHFFTVRRENGSAAEIASYAYHDLFRAFLLERAERDLAPADLRALRAKVAARLEQAGLAADAIEQYRILTRWDDVARLVRAEAQQLIDQGRLRALGDWLNCLPEAVVTGDPWLLFYRGHVLAISRPTEATAIFETAYDMFVAAADEAGQFSAAFATMEMMVISSVSYKPWDRWVDTLGRLLESRAPEEPAAAVRAWHTLLFTCLYRRPSHPLIGTAVAVLDREVFSGRLRPTQTIQAATGLLAYAHFACDEALAARVMPVLRQWLDSDQLAVMSRVLGTTWTMVYHYFDARYPEALHWAERSRNLAQHHGFGTLVRMMSWYCVQSMARLGRSADALAEARRWYAIQNDPKYSFPAAYAASSAALAHFVSGDTATAIDLGERGLEAWRENGFILAGLAWAHSMQAIYRLAAGEVETALALIEHAEAGLAGTVCNYSDALRMLLRAQAAMMRGDRTGAVAHLRACLALAGNHKRIAVLSWARPFLPSLFSLAWEEGIEREKVAELIADWAIPAPSPDEPNWPRPLEVFLLGGFEVRRNGRPLDFGRKPPRKMLALLKAVAISGEHGLSLARACDFFWPDQDGDAATTAQTAALYRLRKALGDPGAIRLSEGRLTLDPDVVWVDLGAFERLAQSRGDQDGLRALSLYRGTLLPDDGDEPWSTAARLRLRDAFARLVERIAAPLEATDPDAAERLYRRSIDAEPLAEASYRGLMRCHACRGRTAEVAAAYRRLRQTLSVTLGIEPSADTERLRRALLEGRLDPQSPTEADSRPSGRTSTVRGRS